MTARRGKANAGMTLLEVLVAVTLLSLLIVGMSVAMRVGLSAFGRTNGPADGRPAGGRGAAHPAVGTGRTAPGHAVRASGATAAPAIHFVFLQAEPQILRMVSTFSLQQGWRGDPQILEFFVIPGAEGRGVRLVVNETPYTPFTAGNFCRGVLPDPVLGITIPRYPPEPEASPGSFVLADKLAFCRISYYMRSKDPNVPDPAWLPKATGLGWPLAIRIDMAPLEPDLVRLQPFTVVAQVRLHRAPEIPYVDN